MWFHICLSVSPSRDTLEKLFSKHNVWQVIDGKQILFQKIDKKIAVRVKPRPLGHEEEVIIHSIWPLFGKWRKEVQVLSDFKLVFIWVVGGVIDKAGEIKELAGSEGTDYDFAFCYTWFWGIYRTCQRCCPVRSCVFVPGTQRRYTDWRSGLHDGILRVGNLSI